MNTFFKELEKESLTLKLKGDNLILSGSHGKLTAEEIALVKQNTYITNFIKSNKAALIDYLSKQGDVVQNNGINKKDIAAIYGLSPLQMGILYQYIYDRDSKAYVEQFMFDFSEGFQLDALQFSFDYIFKKYSILRSNFIFEGLSTPIQCVYKKIKPPIHILDFSTLSEERQKENYQKILEEDLQKGFDFKRPPLMRITLIKTKSNYYRMIWTFHHILLDGWSVSILTAKLIEAYESYMKGKKLEIGIEDKYEDYIKYIDRIDQYEEERFWKNYLQNISGNTQLPFVSNTTNHNSGDGLTKGSIRFDKETTDKIKTYAQQQQITINTLIQGVWSFILSKYTGNNQIEYGVTVSGRPIDLSNSENRVGLYINTIPLATNVNRELFVSDWLRTIQQEHTQAREYQYTSLTRIKEWMNIKKDWFDTILIFENYPISDVIDEKDRLLKVDNVVVQEQSNFLLTIAVGAGDELSLALRYNELLLDKYYVDMIAGHIQHTILQLVNAPDAQVKDLKIISPKEEHQLLNEFNLLPPTFPKEKTVVDLLERQLSINAQQVALEIDNQQLTYQDLHVQSNQLAHYLIEKGVKAETIVGLCFDRSFEMVIAILGIVKAGGTYMPIDPDYPVERINYMVFDSKTRIVLTTTAYEHLFNSKDVSIVRVDADGEKITQKSKTSPQILVKPEHSLYIIYTSGSTGQPKGVIIEHKNIVRLFETDQPLFDFNSNDVWTMFHSYCFDFSVWEMYGALFYGGKLLLVSKEVTRDAYAFSQLLHDKSVTILNQTPSAFYLLQDLYKKQFTESKIRYAIFGGEALNPNRLKDWKSSFPMCKLINMYGITETTIHVTYKEILHEDIEKAISNIGKAIPTLQCYILDDNLQQLPVGVVGEIHVGGEGLARAYLNKADITKERFIDNPFKTGDRLYKTGDLGKWLPTGDIVYVGRKDDQIKIRGYRIELGEIETTLGKSSMIKQSAVISKKYQDGNNQLIAYIIPEKSFDKVALQSWLKSKLPKFMLPSQIVEMDVFPLTANGKLDKKALPEPINNYSKDTYVAPKTKLEKELTVLCANILGLEKVGIEDDFFDIGGHSLLATRLVSSIREKLKVNIEAKDVFLNPTMDELAQVIGQKEEDKQPQIKVFPRPTHIPLSFSQERLWFIDKLKGSAHYHISLVEKLSISVDKNVLEYALKTIVERHEILRTVIYEKNGSGYQKVLGHDQWKMDYFELSDTEAKRDAFTQYIEKPFDLSKDFLFKAGLFSFGEKGYVLSIVLHHIASDGWSQGVLKKEILELYQAKKENRLAKLDNLPIQYADYAIWQRSRLNEAAMEKKLAYWKNNLDGVSYPKLPLDFIRPNIESTNGATIVISINEELTNKINALCKKEGVTLYMLLLTAFKVLLYRYSGQEDICIGSPLANRAHKELENLLGFFVNTIALRSNLSGNPSFNSLLQNVKTTTLNGYMHQDAPFEKVVEQVVKDRDMSMNPLSQVMFVLENTPQVIELEKTKQVIEEHQLLNTQLTQQDYSKVKYQVAKFDLTVNVIEFVDKLDIRLEYCTDLFKPSTIKQLGTCYKTLLNDIVEHPAKTIDYLNVLTKEEELKFTEEEAAYSVGFPESKTVIDLFSEQVVKTPHNIAVQFEENKLTYQGLDKKSNQLANHLIKQGIVKGDYIGICLDRSLEMIVGILAIMKAGGTYVPIDPDYPKDRINYMVQDANVSLIISTSNHRQLFKDTTPVLLLDHSTTDIERANTTPTNVKLNPADSIYIIYTSGSTGKPKGVLLSHRNVVRLFKNDAPLFNFNEKDVWTLFHSFCFDFSVWEMYGALLFGGKLIVIPKEMTRAALEYANLLHKEKVTVLNQTPSSFYNVQDTYLNTYSSTSIRYVIFGGEALAPRRLLDWNNKFSNCRLINMYGITETTVHVTYKEIKKKDIETGVSNIGKAIPTLKCYILDNTLKRVPLGVSGELYIAGEGLAKGYLNRPELTSERFIDNPFDSTGNTRLYKSGDLGKWLPNGEIEYIGRADQQVKIRAYRIELGEIEWIIDKSGYTKQCAVLALDDNNGDKRLVAYLVPESGYTKEILQEYMGQHLPKYMVPSIIIEMERFPLTVNGKLNVKQLPNPDFSELINKNYIAPKTTLEKKIVDIWQEVLGLDKIGMTDDFFDIGGHSLLATRVVSYIRNEVNIELGTQEVFFNPTIQELVEVIEEKEEEKEEEKFPAIVPVKDIDGFTNIPLSYSQERLWFIHRLSGSVHYHMPFIQGFTKDLNIEALEYAFNEVVNRHTVLRTTYQEKNGIPYQTLLEKNRWSLEIFDNKDTRNKEDLAAIVSDEIHRPFNLEKDHMLRVSIYNRGTKGYLLVLIIHHIASDGWSHNILVNEVLAFYHAYITGKKANVKAISLQYLDYAFWQRSYLESNHLQKQLSYWEQKLNGITDLELPLDYVRPAKQNFKGKTLQIEIDQSLTNKINDLCSSRGVTLFMMLLSVFKVLLHRYSNQRDINIGSPIANRKQKDLEGVIGFFVNTIVLRSNLEPNMLFTDLLGQIKQTTLEAYDNQDVPFEKIVERIVTERDQSKNPLFQAMFVLQNLPRHINLNKTNQSTSIQEPANLEVDLFETGNGYQTSKFDLTLNVVELKNRIRINIEYSVALFKASKIEQLGQHYKNLLADIVNHPHQAISEISLLSPLEKDQILNEFNTTKIAYPKEQTVIDLFQQQVRAIPDSTALIYDQHQLSYQELDERSNQLAHFLLTKGVQKEDLIGISLDRSIEMVIGILGIIKSGAAYVPIDPTYPLARKQFIIEDTSMKLLLSKGGDNMLPASANLEVILLDDEWQKINKQSRKELASIIQPDCLVYLIYTSGTSGKPKGVMIEHRGILNLTLTQIEAFRLTKGSRTFQFSSFGFDASCSELFTSLLSGGTLIIPKQSDILNPQKVGDLISQHKIDIATFPPSYQLTITEKLKELKTLVSAGEELNADITKKLQNDGLRVINAYGPTENTICATLTDTPLTKEGIKSIGQPIANVKVYILDEQFQILPKGIVGEIYVGGPQVARGYLNRPELTAERFIDNPFDKVNDSRLYKTGDLGRWMEDGNIEFLGRKDDQVKIRGHRIELKEIEEVLLECLLVKQAVVLLKNQNGNKYLVAYIQPEGTFNQLEIKQYLASKLPSYMFPSRIIQVPDFPLTINGKVDKKALEKFEKIELVSSPYIAPRNKVEQELAHIWKELLNIQKVGIKDNFFELGGHSLLVTRVVAAIRALYKINIPLEVLFQYPTIEGLYKYIRIAMESRKKNNFKKEKVIEI